MQPTPVFSPGESHGQRSLAGYSPWGHKESDTTERLSTSLNREDLLNPLYAGLPPSLPGGKSNISCVFTILLTGHVENCFVMSVKWEPDSIH